MKIVGLNYKSKIEGQNYDFTRVFEVLLSLTLFELSLFEEGIIGGLTWCLKVLGKTLRGEGGGW